MDGGRVMEVGCGVRRESGVWVVVEYGCGVWGEGERWAEERK